MAGVDLRAVQELGGWSSLSMVQRYAHLSPGHRQDAIQRIATPLPGFSHQDSQQGAKVVELSAR